MKCSHCGSHLAPAFAVGDFVEIAGSAGTWYGYKGYTIKVDEEELASTSGCAYLMSVVDDNKEFIGLESWWSLPYLKLLSAAGTFHKSYGELFQ